MYNILHMGHFNTHIYAYLCNSTKNIYIRIYICNLEISKRKCLYKGGKVLLPFLYDYDGLATCSGPGSYLPLIQ